MSAASKSLVRYIAMSFLMAAADVAFADSVIVVSVDGKRFTAKVEDSETGRAFVAKLPLTLSMPDIMLSALLLPMNWATAVLNSEINVLLSMPSMLRSALISLWLLFVSCAETLLVPARLSCVISSPV